MDVVAWGALTLALTAVGAIWTWRAFRRRGLASGLRGAGLTLVPAAAWLTGTMAMFTEIAGSVADWATHLVFSPIVWAGLALTGVSILLFGLSGVVRRLEHAGEDGSRAARVAGLRPGSALPRSRARAAPRLDEDMADIEALLKRRGIT